MMTHEGVEVYIQLSLTSCTITYNNAELPVFFGWLQ